MGNTLKVPGAGLHYETSGSGPVLLFIGGGNSDAAIFDRVAGRFEDRYTVVRYDRRGNSRSRLHEAVGPQSVEEHADDARRLLEHLTDEPADVFGSSSGALIALDLVAKHPEKVRLAVPHEPPAFTLLPDYAELRVKLQASLDEFHRAGTEAAMQMFGKSMGLENPEPAPEQVVALPPAVRAMMMRMNNNMPFFFEYELMPFVAYQPDLKALEKAPLVLGIGADSGDAPPTRPNRVLAEKLEIEPTVFPGGHVGYVTHAAAFAEKLDEVLSA
ncbi:alpha/beta hydrolase [Lentzea tibetensis]|uniref:Alpha/beta hydrolase n=1 Tax=Lentzea tibetensis TaxID=2591470 RepID=A0A563ERK3_9PSEU|nr:alpha/beta hydrolase [Lentzea tibetensis]TWP49491.1 alpha/beta hydrolase [Lentzea tibetensis]